MKNSLFVLALLASFISYAQPGPPQPPRPIPDNSLPKLTYVEPALANSYNWWRRVNPANITYFPSLGISDLNNHDYSLAAYTAKTVLSFQGIEDASILPSLANDTLVYLEPLVNLQKVLLRSTINDAGILHLLPLKNLTHLECISSGPFQPLRPDFRNITNSSMDVIAQLTKLEVLRLYYCHSVSDAGLSKLKALVNLQELDLTAWNITDKGLSNLRNLTKLRVLILAHTAITDNGINSLAALTQLEVLDLSYTAVTDEGINRLVSLLPNMPGFRKLILTGATGISRQAKGLFVERFPAITLVQ